MVWTDLSLKKKKRYTCSSQVFFLLRLIVGAPIWLSRFHHICSINSYFSDKTGFFSLFPETLLLNFTFLNFTSHLLRLKFPLKVRPREETNGLSSYIRHIIFIIDHTMIYISHPFELIIIFDYIYLSYTFYFVMRVPCQNVCFWSV